ncbi:MAG TPA: HD domain-containing protein [Bacteroidetes bacterium]|nr:HD domain-containing protein [Bacteroidota bacterium]
MDIRQDEELIKRIKKLAKQNQELEDVIKKLQKENEKLRRQNEKHKALLESLSTDEIARGLRSLEKTRSLKFEMATVLFASIQGFSRIAGAQDSEAMMDELDEIFFHFDHIVSKYNIEKIKTIGDAYMCAGGIPQKNITNPIDVVMAALEMQHYLQMHRERRSSKGKNYWQLQLGVHTGPVTAQALGKSKISYDIKGDTVNTATRLQSAGVPGEVLISVFTYELVKEFFVCEYYGKMPVKYKGDLDMFTVKGLRPEFSENEDGITPNKQFFIKFGLIQFTDIQEVILDKLEKELPSYLYYHNVKHTVDVVTEVELIGWAEGCSDEEILLLKTAALFHDAGHTVQYDNHEYYGKVMAREMLPSYHYTPEQIDRICEIIMATQLPPKPKNLLEKIICDSDLDYLGRSDFIPVSNTLYRELKEQNKIGSLNDWNKLQIKFISGHQYFTKTARSLREVNKQKQIERIRQLIDNDQ